MESIDCRRRIELIVACDSVDAAKKMLHTFARQGEFRKAIGFASRLIVSAKLHELYVLQENSYPKQLKFIIIKTVYVWITNIVLSNRHTCIYAAVET